MRAEWVLWGWQWWQPCLHEHARLMSASMPLGVHTPLTKRWESHRHAAPRPPANSRAHPFYTHTRARLTHVDDQALGGPPDHASDVVGCGVAADVNVDLNVLGSHVVRCLERLRLPSEEGS